MKPELLAPAGDLECLRAACLYGADAVYVGGTRFSLRARAVNFTLSQLREGIAFAHSLGKKVYVAVNIFFHDADLDGIGEYLAFLESAGADAVIASSPCVIERLRGNSRLPVHLSTQHSVANSALVGFWSDLGVRRVVLARELTLPEIRKIRNSTKTELEVFVHGGMCAAYSGRCTLSNEMTGRDAGRGGCAHSCRWEYDLFRGTERCSGNPDFRMASKDLQALRLVPGLLEAGIDAFKIEGRMRSLHYVATVTNAYRRVIDDALAGTLRDWSEYEIALSRAENRKTTSGFLGEESPGERQLYGKDALEPSQEFVGVVLGEGTGSVPVPVSQRNVFSPGDTLELFTPDRGTQTFILESIKDAEGEPLPRANHAAQTVLLPIPFPTRPLDLIRKVK